MTKTKMLLGSLSNDLFRIANMVSKGSEKSAERFRIEALRWIDDLQTVKVTPSIGYVITTLKRNTLKKSIDRDTAEDVLMYGIILQNHTLHMD